MNKTKRFYRNIPWWRRYFNLVFCPLYGGRMRKLSGRVWKCKACSLTIIHKRGGEVKKYGS